MVDITNLSDELQTQLATAFGAAGPSNIPTNLVDLIQKVINETSSPGDEDQKAVLIGLFVKEYDKLEAIDYSPLNRRGKKKVLNWTKRTPTWSWTSIRANAVKDIPKSRIIGKRYVLNLPREVPDPDDPDSMVQFDWKPHLKQYDRTLKERLIRIANKNPGKLATFELFEVGKINYKVISSIGTETGIIGAEIPGERRYAVKEIDAGIGYPYVYATGDFPIAVWRNETGKDGWLWRMSARISKDDSVRRKMFKVKQERAELPAFNLYSHG